MLTTAANGLGMVKALQQAGFTGVIQTVFYAPQLIVPLKDTYTSTGSGRRPNPPRPTMKKAVKTLNDAGITQIGTGELVGYFSADYFVKLLKATGKNLTAQRFQQIAAKYTYALKDVIGPTYYPQGFQVGPSCTSLLAEQRHGMGGRRPVHLLPDGPQEEGRHVHAGALPRWDQVARRTDRPGGLPGSADDRTVERGAREDRPARLAERARSSPLDFFDQSV